MPSAYSRVAPFAVLHFLILCLVPGTAPSDPMTMDEVVANAPTAKEIALFEELVEWIGDEEAVTALGEASLRRVIQARPASFDVFRSYLDDPIRHQRLNAVPYGEEIRLAAERHGVDGLLIAAIVEVESSFDPCAVSHRGAVGLMQVMPGTAGSTDYVRLSDPELNVDLGTRYLHHLLGLYEGDLALALAAYNAGPANVRRYGGLPPFRETQRYVDRVLGLYVDHHREVWHSSETLEELGLAPAAS